MTGEQTLCLFECLSPLIDTIGNLGPTDNLSDGHPEAR